ncbi:uncharacterized protein LOC134684143 [Mytilus trossulus]|uniref:uncharacterized protein LOC134684143 n=1 Tax=Mytilus trossulus TaxID=6551 RepID=UPI0030049CD6
MASSFDQCGVCTSRHVSKLSVVWCPDCDEGLCQDCKKHHSLSKASRNHTTVPIDEYHKLPSFIANIKLHCDEHDEKFQLFCKQHDEVLCRKCAISEKHAECKAIIPIEDVIQNAKTSVAFTEIESSFQALNENMRLILQDRQKNISALSDSKNKLKSDISAIRHKINQHLDQIQDHVIVELNKAVENSTQQIQSFIASVRKNQNEIDECIDDVETIKKYATDMQTFLGIKQLENKLNETENETLLWTRSNSLGPTVVSYQLNTLLQNISNEITTFGKPVVHVQPCELSLLRKKEGQAQLTVRLEPKTSVEHITLKLKTKFKTFCTDVSGCCILHSGKLVVSNHNPSNLILFAPDGKFEKKIYNIIPTIYDVAYVYNETVAVVSNNEKNIKLVNLKSGKAFRSIHTDLPSNGLTYIKGSFIISSGEKHLLEVGLENTKTNMIGSNVVSTYVASFENNIYSKMKDKNTIVCQNRNGDLLWTFTDETVIKGNRCITVDAHGNLFVVGKESQNVIIISSDGTKHKILLSEKDLCGVPWAIDYHSELKSLLVANEKDGQAFLYTVSYS